MPAAGCGYAALNQCFPGKVWAGRACWLESCLGHHVRQIKTVLHLPSQLVLVALCLINGPRTLRRKIILLLSLEPKLGTLVSVLQPCFQSPMSWERNPPWRGSVLMPCDSWCLYVVPLSVGVVPLALPFKSWCTCPEHISEMGSSSSVLEQYCASGLLAPYFWRQQLKPVATLV